MLDARHPLTIRFGCELTIGCVMPTPIVTMLDVHPERQADLLAPVAAEVRGSIEDVESYLDAHGNLCRRFTAPAGDTTVLLDGLIRDDGLPDAADEDAGENPVSALPPEALYYLTGSRYCETDMMSQRAWDLFGNLQPGRSRVQAILNYGKSQVAFDYARASSTRTASQTLADGTGVCRDFAHLAITFCRALNIPARYVNGYLGDIGIPAQPSPMDFSAWMEVWLGDRWWTFDPRNNARRIGRIVIARGRDAADVPMLASYGPHELKGFRVWTDAV